MEHMRRGTAEHVDVMITVVEPYYRSLEAASRFAKLAKDLGIGTIYAVANKVRNEMERKAVHQYCQKHELELLHIVPFDEKVGEADLMGKSVIDYAPDSQIVHELGELADKLFDSTNVLA